MNLVQLFKEAHTVFFMGTVVRGCSWGKQFCFFAKNCQEPDKAALAGMKFSVIEGGERKMERLRESGRDED